ncbi:hypothetical protein NDU88_001741 [Pleurodeles waltl]|uniref:Uncharacterized protein n=1 Tax=Pleurodeles waltl TaxID=8319 RepID=A0AAV7UVK2_PLEWA|nr:hypothetical protein NDU88_001741 [Pleurodeles waltl]
MDRTYAKTISDLKGGGLQQENKDNKLGNWGWRLAGSRDRRQQMTVKVEAISAMLVSGTAGVCHKGSGGTLPPGGKEPPKVDSEPGSTRLSPSQVLAECRKIVCCSRSGHARKQSPGDQACSETTWSRPHLKWRPGTADGAQGQRQGWCICGPNMQERRAIPHPLTQESGGCLVEEATQVAPSSERKVEWREEWWPVAERRARAVLWVLGVCIRLRRK